MSEFRVFFPLLKVHYYCLKSIATTTEVSASIAFIRNILYIYIYIYIYIYTVKYIYFAKKKN